MTSTLAKVMAVVKVAAALAKVAGPAVAIVVRVVVVGNVKVILANKDRSKSIDHMWLRLLIQIKVMVVKRRDRTNNTNFIAELGKCLFGYLCSKEYDQFKKP